MTQGHQPRQCDLLLLETPHRSLRSWTVYRILNPCPLSMQDPFRKLAQHFVARCLRGFLLREQSSGLQKLAKRGSFLLHGLPRQEPSGQSIIPRNRGASGSKETQPSTFDTMRPASEIFLSTASNWESWQTVHLRNQRDESVQQAKAADAEAPAAV